MCVLKYRSGNYCGLITTVVAFIFPLAYLPRLITIATRTHVTIFPSQFEQIFPTLFLCTKLFFKLCKIHWILIHAITIPYLILVRQVHTHIIKNIKKYKVLIKMSCIIIMLTFIL